MKILYTTPVLEYPAAGGPQLRIENSIKALNQLGELHVIARIDKNSMGGERAELHYKKHCFKFEYVPRLRRLLNKGFLQKVQAKIQTQLFKSDAKYIIDYVKSNNISLIWFGYGNISYELISNIKREIPNVRLVCDTDSVWSRYILRELPYESDVERRKKIEIEGKIKEREEQELVQISDVLTAVSLIDADYYKGLTSEKEKIKVFSNVIDIENYEAPTKLPDNLKKPCMYLAGSFWENSPMEKAARWIIKEVLPIILSQRKDIHFYIVGNRSDEILRDIDHSNISILGRLDSVLPYLKNADVALVPLFFESGTRFKILEAGACGTPIVSTVLGAEGIPVEHGKNILLADEPMDFALAVLKIIDDEKYGEKLAENCKLLIKDKYSVGSLVIEGRGILEYLKSLEEIEK